MTFETWILGVYQTLLLIPWLYQALQLLLGNLVQLGIWFLGVYQTLLLIPWVYQLTQLLVGNLVIAWNLVFRCIPYTDTHSLVVSRSPVATGELSTAWNVAFRCIPDNVAHSLGVQLLLGNLVQLASWYSSEYVIDTYILLPRYYLDSS